MIPFFNFVFFSFFLFARTHDSALTIYLKCSLEIDFCFICERTYDSNFDINFLFILVSPKSFI